METWQRISSNDFIGQSIVQDSLIPWDISIHNYYRYVMNPENQTNVFDVTLSNQQSLSRL